MPNKLVDCVKKVKAQGKDKSSAWAICVKSTGLHPESRKGNHKKKGFSYG